MSVRLEPYKGMKSRYTCPECGKKGKFSRYIDEQGNHIGEDVGRCERIEKCGYHKPPREVPFDRNRTKDYWHDWKPVKDMEEEPIDTLPEELLHQSMRNYEKNNFYLFLVDRFGREEAENLCKLYKVGTTKMWQGGTAFFQVDINQRVRQVKLILYNPQTGKRVKADQMAMKWDRITGVYKEDIGERDKTSIYGKFIKEGEYKEYNLQQCFFGEHLLWNNSKPVAIVEGEKTAVIASRFFPEFVWIATGGANGAGFTKPHVCKVLKDREVILFPDLNQFDNWSEKAKLMDKILEREVKVSRYLEENATEGDREKGLDIADYLLSNK